MKALELMGIRLNVRACELRVGGVCAADRNLSGSRAGRQTCTGFESIYCPGWQKGKAEETYRGLTVTAIGDEVKARELFVQAVLPSKGRVFASIKDFLSACVAGSDGKFNGEVVEGARRRLVNEWIDVTGFVPLLTDAVVGEAVGRCEQLLIERGTLLSIDNKPSEVVKASSVVREYCLEPARPAKKPTSVRRVVESCGGDNDSGGRGNNFKLLNFPS